MSNFAEDSFDGLDNLLSFNEDEQTTNAPSLDHYSPTKEQHSDSDDSIDPLDAFMEGIQKEISQGASKKKKFNPIRDDIDEADDQETYFQYLAELEAIAETAALDDEVEYDYDSDGFIIDERIKHIEPLLKIDHSQIEYSSFQKNFFIEHEDITKMKKEDLLNIRKDFGLSVTGLKPPKPCVSFGYLGLDEFIMKTLIKCGFSQPTPIQAQALPTAISGRDVIGIAHTGSGKTLAYLVPLVIHVLDQEEMKTGDGPIGLILAPTRELCQQIYQVSRKFCRPYNIHVCAIYGGANKYEQSKSLKETPEIIIATPGRIIDFIKNDCTNLRRVTYLVFDEADRMFDLGFEAQVKSISANVRPDRQALMFSATFRRKVETLAREALTDPIRISVGKENAATETVIQSVEVLRNNDNKLVWLSNNISRFTTLGSILIFVTKKVDSQILHNKLLSIDYKSLLLHGDMVQEARQTVFTAFKNLESNILVSTDVAARGLDILHIRVVINYDLSHDIDIHTHRIGRTGRANEIGYAYTLVTPEDKDNCGNLVRHLEASNQTVPPSLFDLALQDPKFYKSRFVPSDQRIKKMVLKSRQRAGLGSDSANTSVDSIELEEGCSGPLTSRVLLYQSHYKTKFVKAKCADKSIVNSLATKSAEKEKESKDMDRIEPPAKKKIKRWDN